MKGLRDDVETSRRQIERTNWPVDILGRGGMPTRKEAEAILKEKHDLLCNLSMLSQGWGVQAVELNERETALLLAYSAPI
jgi:hypothetical protein